MRKYADKFAKEGPCASQPSGVRSLTAGPPAEIDVQVLPYLTEAHLERMGVSTIGARLHILAAIAAMRKGAPNSIPAR